MIVGVNLMNRKQADSIHGCIPNAFARLSACGSVTGVATPVTTTLQPVPCSSSTWSTWNAMTVPFRVPARLVSPLLRNTMSFLSSA